MARPVYQYRPMKSTYNKPLGIALPFNAPSGKKSVDSAYDDPIEDAGSVFVQTYSTEEQAISNIKNLFLTAKGERYMQPNFGTLLRTLLFEQNVEDLQDTITDSLTDDIAYWLPYVSINSIQILQPEHDIIIKIRFKVTSTGANLVINIVADENTYTVGDVEVDTDPTETQLVQINEGVY